jgi:HPt (histidine-containing phosphotransfer) domain-containing protein
MNEYLSKPIREEEFFKMISLFTEGAPAEAEMAGVEKAEAEMAEGMAYQYIDLEYLRQVSQGNRDFELAMVEQFQLDIPADLKALEGALADKDIKTLNQVAHNMKTNVSILGLSGKLEFLLDSLEFAQGEGYPAQSGKEVAEVKIICERALDEARSFHRSLAGRDN